MRAAPPIVAIAAALAAALPASASASAPAARLVGPAQIASAVARAEHSSSLWSTVNICDTRRYPDAIGVRGQMPALGFGARMSMVIQVGYWSSQAHRFIPISDPSASHTITVGRHSQGLYQDGAVFPFSPHAGLLDATITFTWTRNGQVIGHTRRRTTAGHHSADFSNPPRYSAAQCTIS